jgi:hypothetical protein
MRSRRRPVAFGLLLLAALLLMRPGVGRLQNRIIRSISLALGRPVEVSSASLRFLPQPGFDLENFVVYDDPSFSAEPMLRAPEVTAYLRVSSLLRGRLEIAKLSLTEPSLNLMQSSNGHWNLETLLERAAKTPIAPTGKARAEVRPAFPYIQADRGRINFKLRQEKKPYALSEADFGLWQDSEDAWSLRLEARPIRTDLNLSDTGVLKISGSWRRAPVLRQTPLAFSVRWQGAQLGQASELGYGNDAGWRGTIRLSAALTGTPSELLVDSEASVSDFHRYNVANNDGLRLAGRCQAHYRSGDQTLSNISCRAPVGAGLLSLMGEVSGLGGAAVYRLGVEAQDLPVSALLGLLRHVRQNIPKDLVATGNWNGNATLTPRVDGGTPAATWAGRGEISGFRLAAGGTSELALEKIPFTLGRHTERDPPSRPSSGRRRANGNPPAGQTRVDFGPSNLAPGRPLPLLARGWVSRSGYGLSIAGDSPIQRLLQLAEGVGMGPTTSKADGLARLDLHLAGDWRASTAPKPTGEVHLLSTRVEVRGVSRPIEIAGANLWFTPEALEVRDVNASVGGSRWRGSLTVPRQCESSGACPVRFVLHADQIAIDQLNQLLNPQANARPWYQFLSTSSPAIPYLLKLNAIGKLTTDRLAMQKLSATGVSASVEIDHGKVRLRDLEGQFLGGRHLGEWAADFTAHPPHYTGTGTLQRVALEELASAMHDDWISGSAGFEYRIETAGLSTSQLLAAADASLEVEAHNARLPHLALDDSAAALQVSHFLGHLVLEQGEFTFEASKLETAGGTYQVKGQASLGRSLNLRLVREGGGGFLITGTLAAPRVSSAVTPEAQALLKP